MRHSIYLIDVVRCIAPEQEAKERTSKFPLQLHTTHQSPGEAHSTHGVTHPGGNGMLWLQLAMEALHRQPQLPAQSCSMQIGPHLEGKVIHVLHGLQEGASFGSVQRLHLLYVSCMQQPSPCACP